VFIDDGARIARPMISSISALGTGIGLVTADAAATEDNVIELHEQLS
jgi:hypothetical protein